MRPRLIAALVALLALAVAAAPADARKPRKAKRLAAFTSCNQLVDYAGRHIPAPPPGRPRTPRPIFPGRRGRAERAPCRVSGEAPDAGDDGGGDDVSGTNNQEQGVHEPDTVKTDGETLFVLSGGSLHAVDVTGAGSPKLRRDDRVQGVLSRLDAAPRRHAARARQRAGGRADDPGRRLRSQGDAGAPDAGRRRRDRRRPPRRPQRPRRRLLLPRRGVHGARAARPGRAGGCRSPR